MKCFLKFKNWHVLAICLSLLLSIGIAQAQIASPVTVLEKQPMKCCLVWLLISPD